MPRTASQQFGSLCSAAGEVIKSSTQADSTNLYSAIDTSQAGGLNRLIRKKTSFAELMEASAEKDRISEELSTGMPITFRCALPCIEACLKKTPPSNMREAITKTYLYTLSKYPDTFITKKTDIKKACAVSKKAGDVLAGKLSPAEFDRFLRSSGNLLNPGTTADIISTATFLYLLKHKVF